MAAIGYEATQDGINYMRAALASLEPIAEASGESNAELHFCAVRVQQVRNDCQRQIDKLERVKAEYAKLHQSKRRTLSSELARRKRKRELSLRVDTESEPEDAELELF